MKQVNYIAFAADMSYLVTVHSDSDEDQIVLWNTDTGERLTTLKPTMGDGIIGVSCSPDNKHILAANVNGTAHLWRMEGHNVAAYQDIPLGDVEEVTALGFSNDAQYVYIAMDSYVKVWQIPDWIEVNTLSGYRNSQPIAAFVPGQQSIVIGDLGRVDHRDILTGKIIQQISVSAEPIAKICFSMISKVCYIWDAINIFAWELNNNQTSQFNNQNNLGTPCVSGDISYSGNLLVSVFGNNVCTLETSSKSVLQQYIGHTDQVINVIFSPDTKYVLTGSWDGTARLWDTYTGSELKIFE